MFRNKEESQALLAKSSEALNLWNKVSMWSKKNERLLLQMYVNFFRDLVWAFWTAMSWNYAASALPTLQGISITQAIHDSDFIEKRMANF